MKVFVDQLMMNQCNILAREKMIPTCVVSVLQMCYIVNFTISRTRVAQLV